MALVVQIRPKLGGNLVTINYSDLQTALASIETWRRKLPIDGVQYDLRSLTAADVGGVVTVTAKVFPLFGNAVTLDNTKFNTAIAAIRKNKRSITIAGTKYNLSTLALSIA